ncbi:CDP-glycerol glycerophosphotransferase family protein [Glaciihabitans tibetensis]|uniref:CDP-glycerol glycerophosphotransferase family protein n=1 Tax=Glaciihabitans tibetensis TaxID=1266600 RepID=UPI0015E6B437|nr:CDP-glycerol glycerophosphotransferase family protein [Glaciihabitans tibetensis]
MSRFTFAKGNTKKVLALPVYGLGALASLLVPRRAGSWVFGCGSGVGEGALALFLHAREADPTLSMVWLARDERDATEASSLDIPSVPVTSWRGFWLTLRAEVLVVTHGFGDVNRFGTRGGFIVQLWHGIPLKLIHLDSPATLRIPIFSSSRVLRAALRRLYRGAARGISLFPVASPVAAERIRSAFALGADRVVVTGDPRDDVLSHATAAERAQRARALLAERLATPLPAGRVLLFAPTWRDGAADPGIPTDAQWAALGAYLERTESVLVIRPHPLSVGEYGAGPTSSPRIRMLASAAQPDVTPVLPAVDLLITDYSSIAYDFALTGGEMIYLAADVAAYTASRGLYEPYERFSGGREVNSWDAVLALLERRDADPELRRALREHTEAIARSHHAFRDGRNTARVFDAIVTSLKGRA